MQEDRFRWTILATVYLGMVAFAVAYHAIPPVLPLIMRELSLSHAQGGLLMGVFALPGIVVCILSGMLSDRYGIKTVGGISLALMALGPLWAALSTGYGHLLLGRTLTGVGAMAVTPVLYQLLSQWFMGREMGLAMGIFSTAYPLGTMLSFNAFGYLGAGFGWRAPVWVSAGTGALALAIFHLACRERLGEASEPERASFRPSMILGLGLPIWLLAFSWTSFESVIISFLTFAPDYFLGKGLSLAFASALPSLILPAHIFIQPLVGWLVDRLGRKEYFIGLGGLSMALIMVVMAGERESYLLPLIMLGVFSSLVPTPTFAFPPELVAPLYLGLGFGIVHSFSNVGRVLAPYLVGFARDYTGDYSAGFLIMSILSLGATVNIALLALRQRRKGA